MLGADVPSKFKSGRPACRCPRGSEIRFGRQPRAIVFGYLRGLRGHSRAGVSLVEMVVDIALLSIISITA